jgi:hypothetical protein
LLHEQQVIKELREEIKKFLDLNEIESTPYPKNIGHSKGGPKFIVMSAYIKNTESSQINNQILYLKHQEK